MDGFLPFSRASIMLDVVALGMFIVVPVLLWSIYQVRYKGRKDLHRKAQIFLGILLLVVVTLFEIDIRLHGWRHLAEPSPFYHTALFPVLYIHLFFFIDTALLWIYTIIDAVIRFRGEVSPESARKHRRVARVSAIGMCMTAVTGWTFYLMAFVA